MRVWTDLDFFRRFIDLHAVKALNNLLHVTAPLFSKVLDRLAIAVSQAVHIESLAGVAASTHANDFHLGHRRKVAVCVAHHIKQLFAAWFLQGNLCAILTFVRKVFAADYFVLLSVDVHFVPLVVFLPMNNSNAFIWHHQALLALLLSACIISAWILKNDHADGPLNLPKNSWSTSPCA